MKKWILIAVALAMTSCFELREPDYSLYESFQITNTTSNEVTLRFYQDGTPKTVYADLFDQAPVCMTVGGSQADSASLQRGDLLKIPAGQTAVFYMYESERNTRKRANAFYYFGSSHDGFFFPFFSSRSAFLGDSVTISVQDAEPVTLPLNKNELWETWYNKKEFVYYHLWRIE